MGHEYAGIVEDTGADVTTIKKGQFVIGSFFASDGTCPNCQAGYESNCLLREFVDGLRATCLLRVPLADGTLVATPDVPGQDLVPSLLGASDVFGTGWWAATAARRQRRRHHRRRRGRRGRPACRPGREAARGRAHHRDEPPRIPAAAGHGADAVLECVGTAESVSQALRSARPGGGVGIAGVPHGVPHGVSLDGEELFHSHVHVQGGPAPVRRFLPHLINLILRGDVNPGKVFDLTLPLEQVAEGYAAMDQRRAIKTLLIP